MFRRRAMYYFKIFSIEIAEQNKKIVTHISKNILFKPIIN